MDEKRLERPEIPPEPSATRGAAAGSCGGPPARALRRQTEQLGLVIETQRAAAAAEGELDKVIQLICEST